MKTSDKKVEKFLKEIAARDPNKHIISTELFSLFHKLNPKVKDRFIYGGIGMYIEDKLIGGIWIYKNHVSLIFSEGFKLDDKYKLLEGSGKYRRHIKLENPTDIAEKECEFYIKQMYNLY